MLITQSFHCTIIYFLWVAIFFTMYCSWIIQQKPESCESNVVLWYIIHEKYDDWFLISDSVVEHKDRIIQSTQIFPILWLCQDNYQKFLQRIMSLPNNGRKLPTKLTEKFGLQEGLFIVPWSSYATDANHDTFMLHCMVMVIFFVVLLVILFVMLCLLRKDTIQERLRRTQRKQILMHSHKNAAKLIVELKT